MPEILSLKLDQVDLEQTASFLKSPLTNALEEEVKNLSESFLKTLNIKAVYDVFSKKNNKIGLIELKGESIRDFLSTSDKVIVFALTLGKEIEDLIKREEYTDLSRAVILDSMASASVESACDKLEEILEEKYPYFFTERFSPGYSDFPIELQDDFLKTLNTPKSIGLNLNASHLLRPRKSVTALIGLMNEKKAPKYSRCQTCLLKEKCKYGICQRT